jgi:hypothetical protein
MFQWNKDAIKVAAENDSKYEPIPAGSILRVVINSIDDKENTTGTGKNLKPEFEVIEGPYKGRKIWENYAYENPSLKAMEIAWRQIRALVIAVFGDDAGRDLEQFTGKVLKVKTKNETYQEKVNTKVSAYYPDSATPAPAASKVVKVSSDDSDLPF